jgi:hypothetical protein
MKDPIMNFGTSLNVSRAALERLFAGLLFGSAAAVVAAGLLEMCVQTL